MCVIFSQLNFSTLCLVSLKNASLRVIPFLRFIGSERWSNIINFNSLCELNCVCICSVRMNEWNWSEEEKESKNENGKNFITFFPMAERATSHREWRILPRSIHSIFYSVRFFFRGFVLELSSFSFTISSLSAVFFSRFGSMNSVWWCMTQLGRVCIKSLLKMQKISLPFFSSISRK